LNVIAAHMQPYLKNKKIVLGITGCIAAYKAAELVRLLKKEGAEVHVIMTASAKEFITPLTLQTLSNNPVHDRLFNQHLDVKIDHIHLARWADAFLIAPATANIIAKLAHGLADDLLSTTCLATTAPICIAPAMNQAMWSNAITQKNIATLQQQGMNIFTPDEGEQACGEIGIGRLLAPQDILRLLHSVFVPKLFENQRILITAGPTIEPIDPTRYLSNYSSGKMGYALAEAAVNCGATVTLITGPTSLSVPLGLANYIKVDSADAMYKAVMEHIEEQQILISTAAVSDYRIRETAPQKIKKSSETMSLQLVLNPDILASVSARKLCPFIVGFAAETERLYERAQEKLEDKSLDLLVANQVGPDKGFQSDHNSVTVFTRGGDPISLENQSKVQLAYELLKIIHQVK